MPDSSSSNPYIRTYAKDFADLSGKPAPLPEGPVLNAELAKNQGAQRGEEARSAVLERLKARAQPPISEGQFVPGSVLTPTPAAPTVEISREDYQAQNPVIAPAAPEPVITENPVVATTYRETIPESVVISTVAPVVTTRVEAPLQAPAYVPDKDSPSPIHTYTSDFSDRIDTKQASTFSVLAAQADAGGLKQSTKKSHKGALIVAFGILLLVVGGVGAYAAYRYVATHSTVPIIPTVSSLVFADEREALTGEGALLMQALVDSSGKNLDQGHVRVVYLTQASTTADNQNITLALPGGRLVGALQLAAPDILIRNIAPESTVGIVHAGDETRTFFILRVLSYERTFAGMLSWESTMEQTLAPLYPSYPVPAIPAPTIATTTKIIKGKSVISTTTIEAVAPVYQAPHFVDEVASNHDVRALKDGTGKTILLYGYRDKETLIIARDEAAFGELSNRLSATKQQ